MSAVRVVVAIAALLVLLLVGGAAAYVAYFETPTIPETASPAHARTQFAERAFLFVIDGFAADLPDMDALMPTFMRLGREGAHGVARTSSMSLTAPCVFSLGTGRPGTLLLGMLDFHSPPAHVESLPSLVVAAGKRVVLAGDPSWNRQFGWLTVEGDAHDHPEPGVTLDPRVRFADRSTVEFLLPKLRDPGVGLVVVHLSTADSVGHVVTPSGAEYRDALSFIDGLLTRAVRELDGKTVVMVTGDHGMGPRGTHGGRDDFGTLTPYAIWGPGVRPGAVGDVPQTALTPTLAALLGLPLPIAEYPPITSALTLEPEGEAALRQEFLERKRASAASLVHDLALPADMDLRATNAALNEVLFGTTDTRVGWRLLTGMIIVLTVMLALGAVHRTTAAPSGPTLFGSVFGALAVPAAFAAFAWLVIAGRSALPFQPDALAAIAVVLLVVSAASALALLARSPELRRRLGRADLALYFAVSFVVVTPLLTSGWFTPWRYFQALAFVAVVAGIILGVRMHEPRPSSSAAVMSTSLLSAGYYGSELSASWSSEWSYLAPALAAVLAMACWNLAGLTRKERAFAGAVLLAAAAATVSWKMTDHAEAAAAVLSTFVVGIGCAWFMRRDPLAAAAIVIGVCAPLGVAMASDRRETIVFLAAALAALAFTRQRLPLTRPRALYVAAAAALTLRVSLYFALGDHYNLASIRTEAGFRLIEFGLSLPAVIAMLLLKYTLPWLLILAAALPSLAASPAATERAIQLLALGYVARFAAIAAVADPFRVLARGMEGLVALFAISCAELVTLAAAAALILALTPIRIAHMRTITSPY